MFSETTQIWRMVTNVSRRACLTGRRRRKYDDFTDWRKTDAFVAWLKFLSPSFLLFSLKSLPQSSMFLFRFHFKPECQSTISYVRCRPAIPKVRYPQGPLSPSPLSPKGNSLLIVG